jgi:CheY-like chemotaxis protein
LGRGGEFVVEGDAVRLEQVVTNLLTNASKYTPMGGRIELSVREEGVEAVVGVRDTGIGIAGDMLGRVFDLFSQADNSLHRSRGGLGIGLTVVKRLVEMQGGSVRAWSDGPGKGSEFTVRLPLRRDLRPARSEGMRVAGVRRRVLVVEDSPDARRVMDSLLRHWGHEARTAEDGVAGVEAAALWRPEVALVDIGLPGMDGYQVAAAIRKELGTSVFLVALTGYGQPDDKERAVRAGFDLHMVKPVAPAVLARVLAEARPGEVYRSQGDGGN